MAWSYFKIVALLTARKGARKEVMQSHMVGPQKSGDRQPIHILTHVCVIEVDGVGQFVKAAPAVALMLLEEHLLPKRIANYRVVTVSQILQRQADRPAVIEIVGQLCASVFPHRPKRSRYKRSVQRVCRGHQGGKIIDLFSSIHRKIVAFRSQPVSSS